MDKAHRIPDNAIIDLPDGDLPIFRVIDFNFLVDILKNRSLVLTRPSKWDDPFENFLLKVNVVLKRTGEKIGIRDVLDIFFGQCWSDNPLETDATWRIYSPNRNGVRISTTVSKLFDAVRLAPDRATSTKVFIGRVKYLPAEEIVRFVQDSQNATRVILSADGRAAAEWLLVKRKEFSHEREVRLLLRDPAQTVSKYEPRCAVSVEPSRLFDEIVFDPRMPKHKVSALQDELRYSLRVNTPMRQSTLYSLPDLCVEIDDPDQNGRASGALWRIAMSSLKKAGSIFVLFINLLFGYLSVSGVYGYFVAVSPERKETWLLATMTWIFGLVIVDLAYFLLRRLFRKKKLIQV